MCLVDSSDSIGIVFQTVLKESQLSKTKTIFAQDKFKTGLRMMSNVLSLAKQECEEHQVMKICNNF